MKRTQAILILFLVFGAGILAGIVGTRFVVRRAIANAIERPDVVRDRLEAVVGRRLSLTDAQRETVHVEMVKAQERIQSLRDEFQPRFEEILHDLEAHLAPSLSPEQKEKLEALKKKRSLLVP